MTDQPRDFKKSRRRFLADMLFLGGGITAAALVAKSKFSEPAGHPPDVAGLMEMPISKEKNTECPPEIAGEVEAPQASPTPETPPPPPGAPPPPPTMDGNVAAPSPKVGGERIAPRPDGDDKP